MFEKARHEYSTRHPPSRRRHPIQNYNTERLTYCIHTYAKILIYTLGPLLLQRNPILERSASIGLWVCRMHVATGLVNKSTLVKTASDSSNLIKLISLDMKTELVAIWTSTVVNIKIPCSKWNQCLPTYLDHKKCWLHHHLYGIESPCSCDPQKNTKVISADRLGGEKISSYSSNNILWIRIRTGLTAPPYNIIWSNGSYQLRY